MATYDLISRHWNKQQKIFLTNLSNLKLTLTCKAIHDLRVAIKKLRSYLVLYNQITGPDEAGLQLADTEIIFNITGKYRDIEISLKLLGKIIPGKNNNYFFLKSFLENTLKLSEQKINTPLKKFNPAELESIANVIRNYFIMESNDDLLRKIGEIVKQKLITIKGLIKRTNEQPHEVRKQLKDLYYWLKILPDDFIIAAAHVKILNKILDQLGSWQDHQVLLMRSRHFRKDFVPKKTEEYHSVKKLEEQLIEISKKIVDTVKMQIEKLFKDINLRKA